jgi:hypothetical protein
MAQDTWTPAETEQDRHDWEAYQQQHDLTVRQGQTAGIDPVSGRTWFGPLAKAIVAQLAAEGLTIPLYCIQIGSDVYLRRAPIGADRDGDGRRCPPHHAGGSRAAMAHHH